MFEFAIRDSLWTFHNFNLPISNIIISEHYFDFTSIFCKNFIIRGYSKFVCISENVRLNFVLSFKLKWRIDSSILSFKDVYYVRDYPEFISVKRFRSQFSPRQNITAMEITSYCTF